MTPWDEQPREIHTVTFHPPASDSWLSGARHRDLRLGMASAVTDVVGIMDGGGLVAFAAGFLRASSGDGCDQLAQAMLELSRRSELGLVFGIDLGPEATRDGWAPLTPPPESFAFACEAGRPLLWPARQSMDCASEARTLSMCGMKVGLLLGAEVFNPSLRRELERSRPQAILALTHAGPTPRWHKALDALRQIAPTLVVGESTSGAVPEWAEAPPGWLRADMGGTPTMTLNRYRPIPQPESVGVPRTAVER